MYISTYFTKLDSGFNYMGVHKFIVQYKKFNWSGTYIEKQVLPAPFKAGFTSECEQNANVNAACENDAYVYVGKFVHCSAFAEAADRPCSQAVRKPVIAKCKKKWRLHLNVSYANFIWSTDIWGIAFGCSPNIHRTAKCCWPRLKNTSTSNVRIIFACRVRVLFLVPMQTKRGLINYVSFP